MSVNPVRHPAADQGAPPSGVRRSWPVVAGAAVLIAVSTTGGAVAGGMVTGEKIKNYSISQKDLRTGAVDSRTIGDGAVQTRDLAAATIAALKGQAAANGAAWLTGAGAPGSRVAREGDWYLDTSSQDVWTRTTGAWALVANLRGATGATGATGARGADGPAGPAGSNGTNGSNGAAGSNGTAGVDGATWLTGPGAPSSGGVEGDLYLNTTNGDVHRKGPSTWGSAIANIRGADGTNGSNGTNGQDGSNGQGVPVGGGPGQVLSKVDGTDYNTQWTTPAAPLRRLVFAVAGSTPTTVIPNQDVAINFPNEYSDPSSSLAGNTFTALATGSYSIRAEVRVDESGSDLGAALGLVLQRTEADGTYLDDVYHGARVVPSTEGGWAEVTAIIDLTAGQQVRVLATSTGGTTYTRPGDASRIQVYRLS